MLNHIVSLLGIARADQPSRLLVLWVLIRNLVRTPAQSRRYQPPLTRVRVCRKGLQRRLPVLLGCAVEKLLQMDCLSARGQGLYTG